MAAALGDVAADDTFSGTRNRSQDRLIILPASGIDPCRYCALNGSIPMSRLALSNNANRSARCQAKGAVFDFIERFSNAKRRRMQANAPSF